jgi:hypothetical protein
MFNTLGPLFDAIDTRRGLIITPMARYIAEICWSDTTHRSSPTYKTDMMTGLTKLSRCLKDFLFNTGRRNFKTLDPAVDMRNLQDSEIWAGNPVHPRQEIYQKIAEGVVRVSDILEAKADKKRSRADSMEVGSSLQRSRLDTNSTWRESTHSRHDANSVGRASSHFQRPERGRGKPDRGWRGSRGFRPRGGPRREGYYWEQASVVKN